MRSVENTPEFYSAQGEETRYATEIIDVMKPFLDGDTVKHVDNLLAKAEAFDDLYARAQEYETKIETLEEQVEVLEEQLGAS